ncbi:polysaccharide biosynthesis tyrosine autokinase [Chitinophaga sp. 212800010-3]|uniref:GumC family protein n=1 Tax=unclassified Chitinophaga TaxID=2619133 RepID=UPI002DE2925C|nr:Polysaccharide biosynthesis tyrosine autokinase [Chitinophaga sp. 212800010-3]
MQQNMYNDKFSLNGTGFQARSREGNLDLRRILDVFIEYWYLFIVFILIGFSAVWLYLRYTTPDYKVKAKILIRDDQKGGNVPGQELLQQLEIFSNKSNVQNEVEILRSRSLMEKVVRSLQLNVSYFITGRIKEAEMFEMLPFQLNWLSLNDTIRPVNYLLKPLSGNKFRLLGTKLAREAFWNDTLHLPEGTVKIARNVMYPLNQEVYQIRISSIDNAVAEYQKQIEVNIPTKEATIIDLGITTTVPKKGEKILNQLLEAYLQASVSNKNRIADSTVAFIDNRLGIVTQELSGVEKDIQQFKQQNELANLEEQSKLLVSGTGDFLKQLTDQQVRLSVVQSLEQYIDDDSNNKRVVPSALIVQDPTFIALVQKYNTLTIDRERLLISNTESNMIVKTIDQQIRNLRSDLQNNLASLRRGILVSIDELQKKVNVLTQKIREVPGKERIFLDYSRQQAVKQELYLFLLKKREESAISKSSNIAIARIIDSAKSEALPFRPNRSVVYLLGIIGGGVIPVTWLYLKNILNQRIINKDDIINNTPVPILAEIGHSEENNVVFGDHTLVAEQFRALRTNLQFVLSGESEKVLLLTSGMSNEGKSFVATNLAVVLALSGKKVVLMEMDLRKPKISEKLGLSNQTGFSTYVIGKTPLEALIKPSGLHENSSIITSGPIPPNPAELLLLDKTEELFRKLRNQFDYIIIDTAPVGLVTDAQLLGRHADATLYLVRQKYTFKQQLLLSKELYLQKKFCKLNLVINDVKTGHAYGYNYGYGYGYGYTREKSKKRILGMKSR